MVMEMLIRESLLSVEVSSPAMRAMRNNPRNSLIDFLHYFDPVYM